MVSKAFENPLIGHARMRALYRALLELRALGRTDAPACLVGTAIGLAEGDLAIDTGAPREAALLDHIRAVGLRPAGGAVKEAEWRGLADRLDSTPDAGIPGNAFERMVFAAGVALGLQRIGLQRSGSERVALAYVEVAKLSATQWRRLFAIKGRPGLPLVTVALPGAGVTRDLEALARSAARGAENAVPVIPVDAGDPVALYRVAQECLLRARSGGGAAAIACVPCGTDPVSLLARQLVRKGICTERWTSGVEMHLNGLIDPR